MSESYLGGPIAAPVCAIGLAMRLVNVLRAQDPVANAAEIAAINATWFNTHGEIIPPPTKGA